MTAAEAVEFGIVDRIVERRVKDETEDEPKPSEAQEGEPGN
jgi:enoyl-CoA hydratase/carnithine racemase